MADKIALHCMKAYSEYHNEMCEECPIYGETGTDHCFEDALEMAIKALKQYGALQEIRQEILDKYITATGEINTVANGCLKIIDKHIKEIEG